MDALYDWLPGLKSVSLDVRGRPPADYVVDVEGELEVGGPLGFESHGVLHEDGEGVETEGELALKSGSRRRREGVHEMEIRRKDGHHVLDGVHLVSSDGIWASVDLERAVENAVEVSFAPFATDVDVEYGGATEDDRGLEVRYTASLEGFDRGTSDWLHSYLTGVGSDVSFDVNRISFVASGHGDESVYMWSAEVGDHLGYVGSTLDALGYPHADEVVEARRERDYDVEAEWAVDVGPETEVKASFEGVTSDYVDFLSGHDVDVPGGEFELSYDREDGLSNLSFERGGRTTKGFVSVAPAPVAVALSYLR